MTRRAQLLILALLAVPACTPPPPPTQAIRSDKAPPKAETVEPATAEEKKVALARIEAAIKAHGGADKLRKLDRHVQHLRGELKTAAWGFINAKHDIKLDLPGRLSLVVQAPTRDGPQHIILAIDHDKSWRSINGNVADLDAALHASVKEELYYRSVMTLAPLTGGDFVIKPIDGETVNGRPTNAVRVGAKNHLTVDLYFDSESNLLVRTLHPAWDEAGVVHKREVLLAGHKEFEGLKLPTIIIDKRGDDRLVDCTAEYEFVKEFNPKEFARP